MDFFLPSLAIGERIEKEAFRFLSGMVHKQLGRDLAEHAKGLACFNCDVAVFCRRHIVRPQCLTDAAFQAARIQTFDVKRSSGKRCHQFLAPRAQRRTHWLTQKYRQVIGELGPGRS